MNRALVSEADAIYRADGDAVDVRIHSSFIPYILNGFWVHQQNNMNNLISKFDFRLLTMERRLAYGSSLH
jgi:hypothetical protein